jgi:hypothetical protein
VSDPLELSVRAESATMLSVHTTALSQAKLPSDATLVARLDTVGSPGHYDLDRRRRYCRWSGRRDRQETEKS